MTKRAAFCRMIVVIGLFLATNRLTAEELHLNQIQIIGTHNSYHLRPSRNLLMLPQGKSLDYGHAPIYQQLDAGVRSLALDIYKSGDTFRVLHFPGWDERSNCENLKECLGEITRWSDHNPEHIPLIVFIEIKDLKKRNGDLTPMTTGDVDELEDLLWMTIGEDRLLIPDKVRGTAETLEEAILTHGWPRLNECRGNILLQLNGPKALQDYYADVSPTLAGRSMFVKARPGEPEAAIIISNDPQSSKVNELAIKGYLIRTRADTGVKEPATNDTKNRDAAMASGGHIITTDFPHITPHPKTGYLVRFPGGQAWRKNPLTSRIELE